MAAEQFALRVIARHGQAIDRLIHDMEAEPCHDYLADFLAYDTANFLYAFLLTTGNRVSIAGRALRDRLKEAILSCLSDHGIDDHSFLLGPSPGVSAQ